MHHGLKALTLPMNGGIAEKLYQQPDSKKNGEPQCHSVAERGR